MTLEKFLNLWLWGLSSSHSKAGLSRAGAPQVVAVYSCVEGALSPAMTALLLLSPPASEGA